MSGAVRALWLAAALVAIGCTPGPPLNGPGDLPPELDIDAIHGAALPDGFTRRAFDAAASTAVLAWGRRVDARPLEVEQALVWTAAINENGAPRWVLSHLHRHPRDQNEWRVSFVTHSSHPGQRVYAAPPTLDDVYEFLHDSRLDLAADRLLYTELDDDWTVLGGGICEPAWRRTVGALPARPIPPEDPAERRRKDAEAFDGF